LMWILDDGPTTALLAAIDLGNIAASQ
jgi:hypothetical protein